MNYLRLPVVDIRASVGQAYATMRRARRSGVVARAGARVYLFDAPTVVKAIAAGGKQARLGQLRMRQHLRVGHEPPRAGAPKIVLRRWLGAARVGVIQMGRTSAIIGTYSEVVEEQLEPGPTNCYCKRDGHRVRNKRTGDDCEYHSRCVVCVR